MWPAEKANKWYAEKGWTIGFNYVPSTAINSTEMWQAQSYDTENINRELAVAAETGYNSCRVFLQFLVWEAERDGFLDTFDNFLATAHKHGISVMPILFDDCAFSNREPYLGKQQDPIPRIHNSGWTPSPGFTISGDPAYSKTLETYVKAVVKAFAKDSRVLAWDMYNEPGNSRRHENSLPLLRNTFRWSRECAPVQPLTAGVWIYEGYDMVCAELSDIISFHDYTAIETTRARVDVLASYGRPMFCTEWLLRQNNNSIMGHLPYYREKNISVYNWGLIQGKTQTYLSWNPDENPHEGLPEIWQHDLYYKNLKPYDPEEISFIKEIAYDRKRTLIPCVGRQTARTAAL